MKYLVLFLLPLLAHAIVKFPEGTKVHVKKCASTPEKSVAWCGKAGTVIEVHPFHHCPDFDVKGGCEVQYLVKLDTNIIKDLIEFREDDLYWKKETIQVMESVDTDIHPPCPSEKCFCDSVVASACCIKPFFPYYNTKKNKMMCHNLGVQ